jgi:hypothetical protein
MLSTPSARFSTFRRSRPSNVVGSRGLCSIVDLPDTALFVTGTEKTMTPDIGDMTLNFELPDSTGVVRSLDALTASKPRVLIFYRGHW